METLKNRHTTQTEDNSKELITGELNRAMYRANLDANPELLDDIIDDIKIKFPHKSTKFICEVINDGGCGKYGISHRFTIQLVLYWINRRIRDDKNVDRL